MMYKTKGFYIIGKNIHDDNSFEKNHYNKMRSIVLSAGRNEIFLEFGYTTDKKFYCAFSFHTETAEEADKQLKFIDNLLKDEFPSRELFVLKFPHMVESTNRYNFIVPL